MKIIIIGAGQGALQAAKILAKNGTDVSIYEKNAKNNLCYDWTDDIDRKVFKDLKIPIPKSSYLSGCPALIAPFSENSIKLNLKDEKKSLAVERRELSLKLCDLAEDAGAKIYFESPVSSLYFENGKVAGIILGNKSLKADLVIDSSGVNSPFRASLPKAYKIDDHADPSEIFYVFRAHYKPNEKIEKQTKFYKKIYLKHLGEQGISWCIYEPTGEVNVLIGRINSLPTAVFQNALNELKKDNPIIGSELIRGGDFCTIPVRHALSKMVGEGYLAIGDAAFMTTPLNGSGISNSWRAGTILAQKIIADNSVELETLWKYQNEYYKQVGAKNYSIDIIKRTLLNADNDDIRYFFDSGIITEKEVNSISTGTVLDGNKAELVLKALKAMRKTGFLISFATAVRKGNKAVKIAKNIPDEYDEDAITAWQNKLEKAYN